MAWLHGVLAALSLAVGLLHLLRLAVRRRDVVLEASYAAMGLGMAAMYSPVGDPVPAPVWAALFLLCAGWFGGLIVRDSALGALGGEALHLVVGSAAMLFMLGADQRAGGPAGGHPAHVVGAAGMAGIASAAAIVLAAYFVLHVLRCADRLRAARLETPAVGPGPELGDAPRGRTATASGSTTTLRAPVVAAHCSRTAPAAAHLLMTVIMAVMLIGMI
jgi:Domain of unknown function (DUF5134)